MNQPTLILQPQLVQELNSKTGFRNLEINSITGMGFVQNELPTLELKLKSESQEVFTLFLKPVAEKNSYPLFNLLSMAKQINGLGKSSFNSLQIIAKDSGEWPQNATLKILIDMEEE